MLPNSISSLEHITDITSDDDIMGYLGDMSTVNYRHYKYDENININEIVEKYGYNSYIINELTEDILFLTIESREFQCFLRFNENMKTYFCLDKKRRPFSLKYEKGTCIFHNSQNYESKHCHFNVHINNDIYKTMANGIPSNETLLKPDEYCSNCKFIRKINKSVHEYECLGHVGYLS